MKILLLIFVLVACSTKDKQASESDKRFRHGIIPLSSRVQQKLSEAQVMQGEKLYRQHCLTCHGEKGKGDGPLAEGQKRKPADLQALAKEVKNFLFFMSISQWDRKMPGWEEPFSAQEREELTAYIKTFAK